MSVRTHADGFGVWYAVVSQYAYADPAGAARRAIRAELKAREPDTFDPRTVGVSLHSVEHGRMIYKERAR